MSQQLPAAVARFVGEYIRQRNLLLFWRSFLQAFIVVLGWLILWCLVDRGMQLSTLWRSAILAISAAGALAWLGWLFFGTLLARVADNDAAMELETLRPDLDQRLATICSRLADDRQGLGSPEMLEAIAHQVEQYIGEKGPPRLVSFHGLARHGACAASLVVVLVGISLVPFIGLPQLMQRLLLPWSATLPVTTTRLTGLYDANQLSVKEHEGLILNAAAVWPGAEGVLLHYSTDGQTWATRPMAATEQDRFQSVIGPLSNDEQFYLSSGDARTAVAFVRLLRCPAITEFRVRYEYPAYMKREPLLARNVDGLLEAPVGTKASLQILATEKLTSAVIQAKGFTLPLTPTIEPGVMECELTITRDLPYVINMISTKGIDGKGPQGSQIRALEDHPPFVQLVLPATDLRLSPRDLTSVRFQAIDDYGISQLAMRLQINNAQPIDVPVRPGSDPRRRDGDEELDMASLGLKIGDVVAVSISATDGAGQKAGSETRYLLISPHSVDTADFMRMTELQRSVDIGKEMGKQIESATKAMDDARTARKTPERYFPVAQQYQQNVAESGQQAELLRASLNRAIAHSTDKKLSDALAALADRAEVRMIEAHDLIDELEQGEAREANARQRLERSAEQTRQMQQQLQSLASAERAAAALADRMNLEASQKAKQSGTLTVRASEMLERMRQDVNDQARQLGLNPEDAALDKLLQSKVDAGSETVAKVKQANFVEAAQAWSDQLLDDKNHAPMFDRRLSAAADVESARPDSNLQRAQDLNMASRAAQAIWLMSRDEEGRIPAAQLRKEFVKTFAELEKQNALTQSEPKDAQQQRRADESRARMAEWAGESLAQAAADNAAPDEQQRELAMEANEHMANRRYDRASELQRRMALEEEPALVAAESLQEARALDQIAQTQDALRQQLQAPGAEATAIAQRQRDIAQKIDQQIDGDKAVIPGKPRDSRKEAIAAIQAVQERLARMPQQLQEAMQSADVQFQAHELMQRLARAAETAPPDSKETASRAAQRAGVAEADAREQAEISLGSVDPDVPKVMSASLSDFQPETVQATQVLEKQLTPALQKVKQATSDNKAQDMLSGMKQAREAIAEAQKSLRDAQQTLLDRDPLFAAKVYAQAAADALSKYPPDTEAAAQNQELASESLNRQRLQSVRDAAMAHLSGVAQFRDINGSGYPLSTGTAQASLASARQWGALRDRGDGAISAAAHENDPSGYQRMLQVYFRTLGKTGEQEKK